jgi:sugar (pentulose or hexulose) kinase
MPDTKNMIAFDCSNSSIRTILGVYDGQAVKTETILQRPNQMVNLGGIFYWDILRIYQDIIDGLRETVRRGVSIDSVGICSWGIDFALFTKEQIMIANPLAYRNTFGAKVLENYSAAQREVFFRETGILCDKINSVYMLRAMEDKFPGLLEGADKILMIPDILNFLLTGEMVNEPSELSTSQLLDVKTGSISETMCRDFGISPDLFNEIGVHGKKIGSLTEEVLRQIGAEPDADIPVICVPSHDTASAVLAVPAREKNFAFISSGTWALIGCEEDAPIVNGEVLDANLTNELGAFGKITLLRNNMGMFIVQKIKEEIEEELSWEEFYQLSDEYAGSADVPLFDVNNERFFNPENMSDAIWDSFVEQGQVVTAEKNYGLIIRSFLESMAASYKENIEELEAIRGKRIEKLYIVGGGVNNYRLNQLTADTIARPVVTGSSESTSYGNLLAQIKYFEPQRSIRDLREIGSASVETKEFSPRGGNIDE